MQFALTPEQEQIADVARRLFAGFAATRRAAFDHPLGYDPAQWRMTAHDMGFGAMTLAPGEGGAGLGLLELSLVMIEQGRALLGSPFLPSIATALPLLRRAGSPEQAARHAAAIASGDVIALPAIGPALALDGDRLSGEALVPFGHAADLFVAVAGDAAALVDAAVATVTRLASMDQTRPLARVRFDAAPAERLARPGGIARALDDARVALAAECVGGAEAALAATVDYAKTRVQFGRPIGSFQALKHRMADMMIEVEAARTAVYYAAAASDEDDPQAAEAAAIAHSTAVEAYRMVAGNMIQLHGGIGFTWDHDAHLFFKRARAASTLLGTPVESRRRLAALIGLEADAA